MFGNRPPHYYITAEDEIVIRSLSLDRMRVFMIDPTSKDENGHFQYVLECRNPKNLVEYKEMYGNKWAKKIPLDGESY